MCFCLIAVVGFPEGNEAPIFVRECELIKTKLSQFTSEQISSITQYLTYLLLYAPHPKLQQTSYDLYTTIQTIDSYIPHIYTITFDEIIQFFQTCGIQVRKQDKCEHVLQNEIPNEFVPTCFDISNVPIASRSFIFSCPSVTEGFSACHNSCLSSLEDAKLTSTNDRDIIERLPQVALKNCLEMIQWALKNK
jgi:hypothetical protein